MRSKLNRVIPILALAGLSIHSDGALAESLFDGAPAVPPGYADHEEAEKALETGEVAYVELPTTVPEGIALHDDVLYAVHEGVSLTLDLYVPDDAEVPPPVVLLVHGGSWSKGKKEDAVYFSVEIAKMGYATAAVQYRLAPEHAFPEAIQDVMCAMAWLKEHAGANGYDGDRIALMGDSAGGHLAMLAAYSQDPALTCPAKPEGAEPAVKAVVNLYGITDFTTPVAQGAYQVQDFMGKMYDDAPELWEQASPIHHLDANDAPTLTFHGTIDELVPLAQADALHQKLDELHVTNYYERVEGWPHSMDIVKPLCERFCCVIERFLNRHLPLRP
jgi:acetyl esterase/lipase